ncbi:MAG: aldo/keto reductase [Bryobacteraceae bacterium]
MACCSRQFHSDVFPYEYIVQSTEQSLRNLNIECVDLQQLHVWDPGWIERDEWKRAFEDLRTSGKIRFAGISINDHQPESAVALVQSGLIETVQVIYNIFDQSPETKLFPAALQHQVGVLARVPLDEGALTGAINENSQFAPDEFRAFYFRGDRKREVVERVSMLRKDLEGVSETLAQTALRFCLSHPAVSTVIPGMRKVRNVESNCAVSDSGPLDEATLEKVRRHIWNKNYYS